MLAKLITIGDEILIGQVLNTNAAFIGEGLLSIGIKLERITTIGDNEEKIISALQRALEEYDVVIITGGLGPTHDDITKKVLVNFFHTELIMNDQVLNHVKGILQKRKIQVSAINEEQALVPKNCKVLFNEVGTAPGMQFDYNGKDIFVMPGVPHEMRHLMNTHIIPYLREKNTDIIQTKTLLTTGIPESSLFSLLGDINDLTKNADLAFLPSPRGVRIRIMIKNSNETFASNELSRIENIIRERANRFIYGEGKTEIEEIIGELLKSRNLKLAVAESCTGGLIANRITDISGSSQYFERGVVTYSNESKHSVLNVPMEVIQEKGAVSEEVAILMAKGVREISGVDIGISTTGIAGPTGGSELKPVGLIWIGYSDKSETFAKSFNLGGDRLVFKERASQTALDILRKQLLNKDK
jgi:nicotinamide-nucleotide amidase